MLDKKDIKWILILFFMVTVFFYKPLANMNGTFYPSLDLIQQHYFWKDFTINSFSKFHELPLWNPYTFGGMSFIGNPSISMFYPLNLLFFFVPLNISFTLIYFISICLAGLFMYLFLKELNIDRFPSLLGALIFSLSGMLIIKINYGNFTQFLAASLIPLLFFCAELLIKKRKFTYSILFGVSISFMILASHLQLFYYACVSVILYIFLRLLFNIKKENLKSCCSLILKILSAFLIAIFLSAIVLIPMVELTINSNRGVDVDKKEFESFSAMPLKHIITMVLPNIYGSEVGFPKENTFWGDSNNGFVYLYIGIIPLFMLLMSLFFCRKKEKWIFLIISIFTLFIMLGSYTFVYPLLFKFVPGFSLFRAPQKAFSLFVFSNIVLACYGFDYFIRNKDRKTKKNLQIINKLLIAGLIISVICVGIFALYKDKILEKGEQMIKNNYENSEKSHPIEYYMNRPRIVYNQIFLNLIVFCTLLFVLITINLLKINDKSLNLIKFIILIFVFADLLYVSLPLLEMTNNYGIIYEKNNVIGFLEKDSSLYRVLDQTEALNQEIVEKYNIQSISGYDALIIKEYSEFTNLAYEGNHTVDPDLHHINLQFEDPLTFKYENILNLLNVKYVVLKQKINLSYLTLAKTTTFYDRRHDLNYTVYIYENIDVLPRAFVVQSARSVNDEKKLLDELRTFNPKKEILLSEEIKNIPNSTILKEAKMSYYSPNKITVNVSIENSGFLLLSESYYPGWKAFDNGKKTDIIKANYIQRAVYLEKGQHIVEFKYDPLSYKIGKIITLISVVLIGIYLVCYYKNTKRKNEKRNKE